MYMLCCCTIALIYRVRRSNSLGDSLDEPPEHKCLVNDFCVQAFLKEVLNDLCIYNKRGANQGTYELKLEYKRNATQEDVKPAV
jgi:hypothetical protein